MSVFVQPSQRSKIALARDEIICYLQFVNHVIAKFPAIKSETYVRAGSREEQFLDAITANPRGELHVEHFNEAFSWFKLEEFRPKATLSGEITENDRLRPKRRFFETVFPESHKLGKKQHQKRNKAKAKKVKKNLVGLADATMVYTAANSLEFMGNELANALPNVPVEKPEGMDEEDEDQDEDENETVPQQY